MYWEAFMEELWESDHFNLKTLDILKAVNTMGTKGEITDFLEILKDTLSQISNRNLQNFDEKYIKLLFLFHLSLTKYYIPTDEREVAGGYIDILLEKGAFEDRIKYEWVIELKYVKVEDTKKEGFLEKIREQGIKQLQTYSSSDYLKDKLLKGSLKVGLLIFKGKSDYEWVEVL